jgi:hypothetical protein
MKQRMPIVLFAALLLFPMIVRTQQTMADGDSTSFDFWVGEWNLTWKGSDSTTLTGENSVSKILAGKVIQEQFQGLGGPNNGLRGTSVSVFNKTDKKWHQTWVDNQGAYLEFIGGISGDKRIFSRHGRNAKGAEVEQRMVFYNIAKDTFDWDWERSLDSGKSWQIQWRIHYLRKGI